MTRVHPLRPDEDSLSLHLLLSALYIQRMQMKLWACLTRNIWEFANVSICRLIPQKIIPDTKNCAKHLLYCSKYETCHAPEIYTAPSRGIGLTIEITASLYTCCMISDPSAATIFIAAFRLFNLCIPTSESSHASIWKGSSHGWWNRFGAQIGCHSSTEMAYRKQELQARVTSNLNNGVMLLVFQILQERSIITLLKILSVGQFKVQLLIK